MLLNDVTKLVTKWRT